MDATLTVSDPSRPPDYRFRTAHDHVQRGLHLSPQVHDQWTQSTVRYLLARGRCRTSTELSRLTAIASDLHGAIQIYERERSLRFMIEARVLAGESMQDIASALGVRLAVVTWYTALFFDVADRRAATDFIVNKVIFGGQSDAAEWENYGWKLIGFFGGRAALEEVLRAGKTGDLDGLLHALALEGRLISAFKTKMAAQKVQVTDNRSMLDLMQIATRGGNAKDPVEPDSGLVGAVQGMLESLPFKTIWRNEDVPEYDRGAVEPQTDEFLRLAVGLPVPGWEATKNLSLPGFEPSKPQELPAEPNSPSQDTPCAS
jgi:hypothetical protein